MNQPTMVKVCGITRQEDASTAIEAGADLLGFIFHCGSPRCVTPEQAAAINTGRVMRVGVFVKQNPGEVLEIMAQARLHLAQLHGDQDLEFCKRLGRLKVMRTFWPTRYETREELEADLEGFADHSRFFLLDSGLSGGGHGGTVDFGFLDGLRSRRPWFLAGGLTPANAAEAVSACQPCGVDLNSGVEAAPGIKDPALVRQALRCLRGEPDGQQHSNR